MSNADPKAPSLTDSLVHKAVAPLAAALREELGHARDEMAERAQASKTGIVLLGAGAVLAIVTVGLAASALVTALMLQFAAWLATLLVFALFAVVTTAVALVGARKIRRGIPPLPTDTVKEVSRRLRPNTH